eukprot:g232.t1
MHFYRASLQSLLCVIVFLSKNWTEASVVEECPSTNFPTLVSFDNLVKSKWTKRGPTTHLSDETYVSSKAREREKHLETKIPISAVSTGKSTEHRRRRLGNDEEIVESVYFPGAEIPADVEKTLASLFSQKDPQWVECHDCKDNLGNPMPKQIIPEDMKQAIGDFAKKFHESREEGPLIDESQVPQERATATVTQQTLTPSPNTGGGGVNGESSHEEVKSKNNRNCKTNQEVMKTVEELSRSETDSPLTNVLNLLQLQKKYVLILLTLLILVSTISAILFVYGPADVLQWILSSIIYSAKKFVPEQRKQDQRLSEENIESEDLETEKLHQFRASNKNGKLKSKDSGGRSPTFSKKKAKPQSNQKLSMENNNGTNSSKKDKHKSKSHGPVSIKTGVSKTQEKHEQEVHENGGSNKWQEVTTKGRSGRSRSSSRDEADIFPCGSNRTVTSPSPPTTTTKTTTTTMIKTNSTEIPQPSTPDNPHPTSEGFSDSPPCSVLDRVQKDKPEKLVEEPKVKPEKIKTKEVETGTGGGGLIEDHCTALQLTMSTSGAFSDDSGLDIVATANSPVFPVNGIHQIKTEAYSDRKTVSPFYRQQSPGKQSPFASSIDLPLSAVNSPFSPVPGFQMESGFPLMTPSLPPTVMQRSSPTSPLHYHRNDTGSSSQSRISCLLQNLKTNPFSQNTVSQCHSPLGVKRLQSEDLGGRSPPPPARIASGGAYGLLDVSRSSSQSGNLNNRIGSSGPFSYLVNEGLMPQQSAQQLGPNFRLNRQFSGGLQHPQSFPSVSDINQRTGSLPLNGSQYSVSSSPKTDLATNLPQHPLSNDCSLFSSNPSIWSVDLAVDKEFVNSSINGTRFNSPSKAAAGGGGGGGGRKEFNKNVDFKMCLPDHLLSDTNAAG